MPQNLKNNDYSVVKLFSKYARVPETIAKDTLQKMPLNTYAAFVAALDANNEEEIMRIIKDDKETVAESFIYFQLDESLSDPDFSTETINKFLEKASIKSIMESTILSNYSILEQYDFVSMLPTKLKESFDHVTTMLESELDSYLGMWIYEDATYSQKKDIAAIRHFYENVMNPQLKSNIARIAQKPNNNSKSATFTDPKTNTSGNIVSADPIKKVIATQDDKGEVSIHQIDPRNKDNIVMEDVSILKHLAGIK